MSDEGKTKWGDGDREKEERRNAGDSPSFSSGLRLIIYLYAHAREGFGASLASTFERIAAMRQKALAAHVS